MPNSRERGANRGRDGPGVAADEDVRAAFQQGPDVLPVILDRVLDVLLRLSGHPGEGRLDPDDTELLEVLHLVRVEVVRVWVAAAEEEQRLRDWDSLLLQRRPVLEEAPVGREAGASPNHDHREVRVRRWPEPDARVSDEDEHGAVGRAAGEVVRANPGELTPARAGRAT